MKREISPLAGQEITLKNDAHELGGQKITVEDWWENVAGESWMQCNGNPACLNYAVRSGFSPFSIPIDNDVLYGKDSNGLGHLFHITEIQANDN